MAAIKGDASSLDSRPNEEGDRASVSLPRSLTRPLDNGVH